VDRPPVHPILMRWAARHAGREIPRLHASIPPPNIAPPSAARRIRSRLGHRVVRSLGGSLRLRHPTRISRGRPAGRYRRTLAGCSKPPPLRPYRPLDHPVAASASRKSASSIAVGDTRLIVGWVEGPVAEYADLRGVSEAAMDFLDDPDACRQAMDVIVDSALEFITLQVEAGAHCIGIGDAFCSQIGPALPRAGLAGRETHDRPHPQPGCLGQTPHLRQHRPDPARHDRHRCRHHRCGSSRARHVGLRRRPRADPGLLRQDRPGQHRPQWHAGKNHGQRARLPRRRARARDRLRRMRNPAGHARRQPAGASISSSPLSSQAPSGPHCCRA
jgi:hypothetical protein